MASHPTRLLPSRSSERPIRRDAAQERQVPQKGQVVSVLATCRLQLEQGTNSTTTFSRRWRVHRNARDLQDTRTVHLVPPRAPKDRWARVPGDATLATGCLLWRTLPSSRSGRLALARPGRQHRGSHAGRTASGQRAGERGQGRRRASVGAPPEAKPRHRASTRPSRASARSVPKRD